MTRCADCSTLLSRYNTGTRCDPCERRSANRMPQWAWDTTEFRTALATKRPSEALKYVRAQSGLSRADFAAVIGWSIDTLKRCEQGASSILHDGRELTRVAHHLGIPWQALAPYLSGRSETRIDLNSECKHCRKDDENMDRRDFGKAAAVVAGAALFSGGIRERKSKIGSPEIAYLKAASDRLNAAGQELSAPDLVTSAMQHYRHGLELLDYGDYGESTGIQLASAVGDLAEAAGWLAYESDDHLLARRCYNEALGLAERAGDNDLAVRTLESMTRQSCHLVSTRGPGSAREALQFSRRGADRAYRHHSNRVQALVHARLGIAAAAAGDAREFEHAMTLAWRSVDRGLDDDGPVWLRFVTPQEIEVHQAKGSRHLGRHGAAVDSYRRAVNAPGTLARDKSVYQVQLSAILAESGDVQSSITEGLRALDSLSGQVSSPRLVSELHPVRAAAQRASHSGAEEFITRFDRLLPHRRRQVT
jgi:transcriptional regulator with XRE-family HTH domain